MPSLPSTFFCAALILTAGLSRGENLDLTPRISRKECIQGCFLPLSLVSFGDVGKAGTSKQARLCGSTLYRQSVYECAETYCSVEEVQAGWEDFEETCAGAGVIITAPLGEPSRAKVTVVDCVVGKGKTYHTMIIPTSENFELAKRSVYTMDRQMIYHHSFGWALWVLVGAMTLAGLGLRLINRLKSNSSTASTLARSEQPPSSSPFNSMHTAIRKHLTLPALFGYRHSQHNGLFTILTRFQSFWITLYILINLIFSCVGYSTFKGNWYYPDESSQLWKYIADRTGIMAWYNLPLVWLLAGRNDFLLFITGVSYSTLNVFHRWAARIFTLQAVVHSIAYTWLKKDSLAVAWETVFWRAGVFATCVACLSLVVSVLPLRRRAYEIFLITHIILAVALLVLLYYHVLIQQGQYNPHLYACIGIWCGDRLIRYIRLIILSTRAIKGPNAKASITGRGDGLIRLTILTNHSIAPSPGSYYFLYHPLSITPWENHPFTLASWKKDSRGKVELTFLIAVREGFTKRLKESVENGKDEMRVLVEGPYGTKRFLGGYDKVLFIAGGSGITAVLPHLQHLQRDPATETQTAVVWCVKDNAYASEVLSRELSRCNDLTVHVTDQRRDSDATLCDLVPPSCDAGSMDKDSEKDSVGGTEVVIGRPDVRGIIDDHISRLRGAEKLAVLACGPGGMMDDLRRVMVDIYGHREGQVRASQVDYFPESFSW